MIKIYGAILFGAALRIILAFSFYGGADATGGASFFDFIYSGYDAYSVRSPWPYLPFTNAYAWLWGHLAELFNINVNLAYRLSCVVYDVGIGIVVYQYARRYIPKKAIHSLWLYMINPVTIFIVSLLGFTDSSTIFFLLLACYFTDLFKDKNSIVLSAISLAISISIKPFTFIFIPFFILRSSKRWLYFAIFVITCLIFNSYYILGSSFDDILYLSKLIVVKTLVGSQVGTVGIAPILYQLGPTLGKASLFVGIFGMACIIVIYIIFFNKLKSVEFCFIIFLITLIFNNHIQPQYLLWIVPFAIITQSRSRPYVIFISLFLVSHITVWYLNMSAYSPHVILGSFMPSRPDNLVRIFFNIMNNIWVKNIIYLLAVMFLMPVQVVQKLYSEAAKLILHIRQTFNGQNLLIATTFTFIFGMLFYLVTYRFYFVINSYVSDDITTFDLVIRNFILIILPTIIGFYIILTYSSKRFFIIALNNIVMFLLLFYIYIGYRPHLIGIAYTLIISICVFVVLSGFKWLLMPSENDEQGRVKLSLKNSLSFVIGTIPMIVILVLSWPDLYHSVGNKFYTQFENVSREYKSYKNFPRGRYPNIISVQPPRNGFNYGQNYIFETTFVLPENIEDGKLFLVSEDHHKVIINGNETPTDYGHLYTTRHGSKRKMYDFGIRTFNIQSLLTKGTNNLIVWNNLSAAVHTTGIGVKLELETKDGEPIILRSEDLKWDVYVGKLKGDSLVKGEKIGHELINKEMITMEKHCISPVNVNKYLTPMDYLFIEPKLSVNDLINKTIEFWILVLFSSLSLLYFILNLHLKEGKDNKQAKYFKFD